MRDSRCAPNVSPLAQKPVVFPDTRPRALTPVDAGGRRVRIVRDPSIVRAVVKDPHRRQVTQRTRTSRVATREIDRRPPASEETDVLPRCRRRDGLPPGAPARRPRMRRATGISSSSRSSRDPPRAQNSPPWCASTGPTAPTSIHPHPPFPLFPLKRVRCLTFIFPPLLSSNPGR